MKKTTTYFCSFWSRYKSGWGSNIVHLVTCFSEDQFLMCLDHVCVGQWSSFQLLGGLRAVGGDFGWPVRLNLFLSHLFMAICLSFDVTSFDLVPDNTSPGWSDEISATVLQVWLRGERGFSIDIFGLFSWRENASLGDLSYSFVLMMPHHSFCRRPNVCMGLTQARSIFQ